MRESALPLVLAVTGASGAPYFVRLLRALSSLAIPIHLTVSPSGAQVLKEETGIALSLANPDFTAFNLSDSAPIRYHHHADFNAGIASGSFRTRGMVICPCSMSTVGAIAHGITENLITRAADVHLKERRKLILVPRETPLSLIHLENLTSVTRAGAIVLPAMPGWYHRPAALDELLDFVVARICDQLEIDHHLTPRWGKENHDG
jgi:4-hydroxy-3-polyprenylbenzoate decarboxylase